MPEVSTDTRKKPNRRRQHAAIAYINVTPLVDVLLILVAILMLMLPLYIKKLPIQLPQTGVAAAPELSKAITVSLDSSGKFYLDSAHISESELLSKINPATSIKFAVGKDVKYENLAKAVLFLKTKNPKEISLIVI